MAKAEPTSFDRPTKAFATLTMQVYQTLRKEILEGQLSPGTRLVRRTLSKRLGVSPVPVTEALYRLEQDGLVESEPMYGARVKPLRLEDVQNTQALREALECQAARACAENASDSDLRQLRAQAAAVDELMGSEHVKDDPGMRLHRDLHCAIARAGGFSLLEEQLQRVWLRRYMELCWINTELKPVPPQWHRQLVEAISSRDVERAEAQMRHHVRFGIDHLWEAAQRLVNAQD